MEIGFYNLSGRLPNPEDFEGLRGKSPAERLQLGLGLAESDEFDVLLESPFPIQPLVLKAHAQIERAKNGEFIFAATVTFETLAWVTHLMFDNTAGIRRVHELPMPLAMRPGNKMAWAERESTVWHEWATPSVEILVSCGLLPAPPPALARTRAIDLDE